MRWTIAGEPQATASIKLVLATDLVTACTARNLSDGARLNAEITETPDAGDRFRKARQEMQDHLVRWQANGRQVIWHRAPDFIADPSCSSKWLANVS
jgi:hypothetical protein